MRIYKCIFTGKLNAKMPIQAHFVDIFVKLWRFDGENGQTFHCIGMEQRKCHRMQWLSLRRLDIAHYCIWISALLTQNRFFFWKFSRTVHWVKFLVMLKLRSCFFHTKLATPNACKFDEKKFAQLFSFLHLFVWNVTLVAILAIHTYTGYLCATQFSIALTQSHLIICPFRKTFGNGCRF